MDTATSAELEARDARRLSNYRQVTYRSFLFAGAGFLGPCLAALIQPYSDGRIGVPLLVAGLAGLVVMGWCYHRLVKRALGGGVTRRDVLASGAVAFALTLMMFSNPLWCTVPLVWSSALALSPMDRRRLAALCLGTSAVVTAVGTAAAPHWGDGGTRPWWAAPVMFAIYTAVSAFVIYINRYQRRMWDLHQEAHAAREALARVAVTEERLRFSRDLHDLLGHSLSLIAVKSELAIRLAEADPDRARAEMADVRRAARDALREVRAAVRGYRAVELDAELAGVRAVLEAAGVRCETGPLPDGLPAEARAVLAWVIREGATNIIKHSEARRCAITLTPYGGGVVLEMDNDGVRGASADPGTGLAGLTERIAVVGGTLTARRHGRDGFLLRATVPVPDPVPAGSPA
ncbi:histidine kinase [Actinomadura macrotermitis]|uniref:Signal transduction histidine kinase subgroup 3 dimerisation and phosphoacceptor domain-containing protein n=1 Tax=Actinomadura macrotermitis TaxID=2585200 RepID=A0A7K0BMG6_9ACTN|nr:histidine kinase [Actinomadura macrotermitis]MQY02355.1 hypothetical protein [Actinomadura macrotermitis]